MSLTSVFLVISSISMWFQIKGKYLPGTVCDNRISLKIINLTSKYNLEEAASRYISYIYIPFLTDVFSL